ncbi:MAG: hypothetical protein SFU86_15895 [Pirellulaceae bacterium]|nr:hypothetical protein [Pirellulaceae bacterium]
MTAEPSDLKARDEAKRDGRISPAERWRQYQDLVAWMARQPNAPPCTPAACKAEERRKLAELAAWQAAQGAKASESGPSTLADG